MSEKPPNPEGAGPPIAGKPADELIMLVYDQLRKIAQQRMNEECREHTLSATAVAGGTETCSPPPTGSSVFYTSWPWVNAVHETIQTSPICCPIVPSLTHAAPLIGGKKTVVRVYPGLDGFSTSSPLCGVRATLTAWDDSVSPPVLIGDVVAPETVCVAPTLEPSVALREMRTATKGGFDFEIPEECYSCGSLGVLPGFCKSIRLEAQVMPPYGVSECCHDSANYVGASAVVFGYPVDLNDWYMFGLDDDWYEKLVASGYGPLNDQMDIIELLYPTSEFQVQGDNWGVATDAEDLCDFWTWFHSAEGDTPAFIFMDPDFECDGAPGTAWDQDVAVGAASGTIPAHEMAHLAGVRHHSTCDGEANSEFYPFAHGSIDGTGYDTRPRPIGMRPVDPGSLLGTAAEHWQVAGVWVEHNCGLFEAVEHVHDFMSYGGNRHLASELDDPTDGRWVSVFTFRSLLRELNALIPLGVSGPARAMSVTGAVEPSGGEIDSVFQWDSRTDLSREAPDGEFSLIMRDVNGDVLLEHRFDAPGITNHVNEQLGFALVLPLPEEVSSLELLRGTETLDTLSPSAHPPTVSFVSPGPGEVWTRSETRIVSWSSFDEDGDSLLALLEFSSDGGTTWRRITPIARTSSSLVLNTDTIPGSQNSQVRVRVSDGFHTTVVTSPSFVVAQKPPMVTIAWPFEDQTVRQGSVIEFRGRAFDPDHVVPDSACRWVSNVQGPLAVGKRFTTQALVPGKHRVTFECEDEEGQRGSDRVTVLVLPRSGEECQADADCRDDGDPSTIERCIAGVCGLLLGIAAPGQCQEDAHCPGDANPCTIEVCINGICMAAPRDCEDNDSCTLDSCDAASAMADPNTGCVNRLIECPRGNACNPLTGQCQGLAPCTCDVDCPDDGVFCNGGERCVDGLCGSDGNPCTDSQMCDERNRTCISRQPAAPIRVCGAGCTPGGLFLGLTLLGLLRMRLVPPLSHGISRRARLSPRPTP